MPLEAQLRVTVPFHSMCTWPLDNRTILNRKTFFCKESFGRSGEKHAAELQTQQNAAGDTERSHSPLSKQHGYHPRDKRILNKKTCFCTESAKVSQAKSMQLCYRYSHVRAVGCCRRQRPEPQPLSAPHVYWTLDWKEDIKQGNK